MKYNNLKTNKKSKRVFKSTTYVVILNVLLILYCISLLFPLIWMFYSSFKDEIDYTMNIFGLPEKWHFKNYIEAYLSFNITINDDSGNSIIHGIGSLALNSMTWAMGSTAFGIFLSACVAYVLNKYRFVGSKLIYNTGIVLMTLSFIGSMPSALLIKKSIGIYDNMLLSILTCNVVPFSGFTFLILYGAFSTIPWDYGEAASIDGAGYYRVMFKIFMPMIIPTCAVLFILGFLSAWNDYSMVLVWLPSYPTLAYGMYLFQFNATGGAGVSQSVVLAGFVIIMIPTIILYLSTQNVIIKNFKVGGLKG